MALKGTLRDFGLADIFQLIGIQRKTGVLVLKNGDKSVVVSFLSGGVVSAESSEQALEDRLGSVLVKSGKITERQLSEALKAQKTTLKRLGRLLVDQKSISTDDLKEALRVQVSQIVHQLFRWRDGEYDFSQEETIDYDREHFVPISAENILMEGARMLDEWPIIERHIRHFDMVLRRKSDTGETSGPISVYETDIDFGLMEDGPGDGEEDRIGLSREEAMVFRLIDGRSTVRDLIDRCPLGEFETCRILYELMSRALVEEGLGELRPLEAAPAPRSRSLLLRGALLLLPLVAVASILYGLRSPLSPIGGQGGADPLGLDRIRFHLSQARAGRIDRAIRLFYLDRQALPNSLGTLALEGFLDSKDLTDPWGHPYEFQVQPGGYLIAGSCPPGGPQDVVRIESQFVAAQRLALEGGTQEAAANADVWP